MALAYEHFKTLLKLKTELKSINFFTKNQTRFLIWLLAVTTFKEDIDKNFSYYYTNIPNHISSQININNQIDMAIESGFLEKKHSEIDKRSSIVIPTKQTVEDYNVYRDLIKKCL